MRLRILEVEVWVRGAGAPARLLRKNFGAMSVVGGVPDLVYDVSDGGGGYRMCASDGTVIDTGDDGAFLYHFEKHLTIALQRRRPELFFLHAAVLERGGRAYLLVAPSGVGKSTTAWALLHHGFRYLSDELAPIDIGAARVHPYPHALCLKGAPPAPYRLPEGRVITSRTLHVPPWRMPARTVRRAVPLEGMFFLRRLGQGQSTLRRISTGETAAQLYANALNALAHPGFGLDAAVALAERCPAYELSSGALRDTARVVSEVAAGRAAA